MIKHSTEKIINQKQVLYLFTIYCIVSWNWN